jgi:MoaA/NifB/PqqE/SkfB family radical SAM enzyme
MTAVIHKLPILILSPHSRCNCRCVMCDIWKSTDSREMTRGELEHHLDSIGKLAVERVVFSGGEPLMHSDLFRLCDLLKTRGIRLTLLSTGLLLERNARAVAASFDEVIVSLDGPPEIHDRIRRVPGAFERLAAGVGALRRVRPDIHIAARCTVQRQNSARLLATAQAARSLELNSISFLAADLTSAAFNRPNGWSASETAAVALNGEDIEVLESEIAQILEDPDIRGFVLESEKKLRRIADHFRAHLGLAEPSAPACNAPWVSAVLETDGTVRPCFFHPPIGRANGRVHLLEVVNSPAAIAFREQLDVAQNPVCRRCVCSLNFTAR